MKASSSKLIHLTLSVEEALWLKELVQNPLVMAKEDENPESEKIRANFFNCLRTQTKELES